MLDMLERNRRNYRAHQESSHQFWNYNCSSSFVAKHPTQLIPLLLLFSMLVSRGSSSPLPSQDVRRVKESNFTMKLENPCALAEPGQLRGGTLSLQERMDARTTAAKELRSRVQLLNESATTILKTNVVRDCSDLNLPLVALVPTAAEISNNDSIEVLRMFYTSLLNHTAHVYFISEQIQRYAGESCNSQGLPTSVKTLGASMRELMCILRLCILTLKDNSDEEDDAYLQDSYEQVLNEQLMDLPMCSRRLIRDCQTIYSTVTLLTKMTVFIQSWTMEKVEST